MMLGLVPCPFPPMKKLRFRRALFLVSLFITLISLGNAQTTPAPAGLGVKDGQKVAFFGDEVTETGNNIAGGYVKLVISGLDSLGVKIVPTPAGHGGTTREMLARLDHDVLSAKPDWILFSSGFGDKWNNAIDLDTYKKNVTSLLDQMQAAGAKVMILTPPPLDPAENDFNPKLGEEVAFLLQLAKDRNLPLADINAAYFAYIKTQPPGTPNLLESDINHPNPLGHELIAQTILQAWGASPDQMAKVENMWLDSPANATVTGSCFFCVRHTTLSLTQYAALKKVALARKMTLFDLENEVYMESVLQTLKAHGDFAVNGWPDNISNEADPIFTQKVMDLIK
jgi:lysophospholipase L1-like esterase